MPIRRELRHLYRGPAWRAIRERILARAAHKCERCGVPNHTSVLRQFGWWTESTLAATIWASNGPYMEIGLPWKHCGVKEGIRCFPNTGQRRWVYIVLTISHLNHDPTDNRDDNLAALCQWCHLKHDVRFHHANARRTRAAASGQAWLSKEIEEGVRP